MSDTSKTCPVCGAGATMRKGAVGDCAVCATPNAFVEYFTSQTALDIWNAGIRERIAARQGQRFRHIRESCSLIVGAERIAFHDAGESRLVLLNQKGKPETESNVRQYSVSNLHQVTLKTNGTATVKGDSDAAQEKLTGIKAVLAAPRCTYTVNSDGTVSAYGITAVRQEIAGWKNIRAIACGTHHLVGLTEEGTVVQADGREDRRNAGKTASWKNVRAIAAAFNYTLGLHADGTVSYAGSKADVAQAVAAWRNVVAIAADSQYAVGLTGDGQVLLAGSCSAVLDGGRGEARNWKNIVCIGAGNSVIAGLTADGSLLLAGWCPYREEITAGFKAANPAKL